MAAGESRYGSGARGSYPLAKHTPEKAAGQAAKSPVNGRYAAIFLADKHLRSRGIGPLAGQRQSMEACTPPTWRCWSVDAGSLRVRVLWPCVRQSFSEPVDINHGQLGYPSLERRRLKDVAVIVGPDPANYLVLVAGTIQ